MNSRSLPSVIRSRSQSRSQCPPSVERFLAAFDFGEVIDHVRIDVGRSHFWDISAVAALDKAVLKFRREGTSVEIIGLNEASATMIDRFGVHDKPGAEAAPGAH